MTSKIRLYFYESSTSQRVSYSIHNSWTATCVGCWRLTYCMQWANRFSQLWRKAYMNTCMGVVVGWSVGRNKKKTEPGWTCCKTREQRLRSVSIYYVICGSCVQTESNRMLIYGLAETRQDFNGSYRSTVPSQLDRTPTFLLLFSCTRSTFTPHPNLSL